MQQELEFLASLEFFGIKLGLNQTRELFRRLGNPQDRLKFIHVAGSNGKGSLCALLEQAFRSAGLKTGFYSSPHLVQVGERFRINGAETEPVMVAQYVRRLLPAIQSMANEGMKVTYFEATTALAACIFADAKVDIVLWETGMGGRLDSTNIVTPLASVITGISMEHADRLGDTLGKIAAEKAGIIKEQVPVFCASATPDEAKAVIRTQAEKWNAPLTFSSRIISVEQNTLPQIFTLEDGSQIATSLAGPHQRENAALAAAVLKYAAPLLQIDPAQALAGLRHTCWQARFQLFPAQRLIMDAAHNPEGAQALAATLKEVRPGEKFHFIFGAFSDKDTAAGIAALADLALSFRFVHMETNRSSKSGDEMAAELAAVAPGVPCTAMPLKQALTDPVPDNAWRVLCGSIHLCGDAIPLLTSTPS